MADTAKKTTTATVSEKTVKQEEPKFRFAQLREGAHVLGYENHVLDGAAAFHGWNSDTEMTKGELAEKVKAWLGRKVEEV